MKVKVSTDRKAHERRESTGKDWKMIRQGHEMTESTWKDRKPQVRTLKEHGMREKYI